MRRALDLAHEGRFTVSPNPRVGCVIAKPFEDSHRLSYRIIGEGFHFKRGEPHAERVALRNCREDSRGAVLFVNLEPCGHTGLTPPCTDTIVEAGIRRVVAATLDPFPQVAGKGVAILREKGIQVDVGLLEADARYENRFFFHRHERGLPWVLLKAACSLDGKMATGTGDSKWITGEIARAHVQEIRAEADAILVGVGTVMLDDPRLTARFPLPYPCEKTRPVRVILDPAGAIPLTSRILCDGEANPVWILGGDKFPESAQKQYLEKGARVFRVSGDELRLDLSEALQLLARENILSVLVEGGPRLHTSFLESGLVNELLIYIAPILIGGSRAPTFYMGQGVDTMSQAGRLERVERLLLGEDTLIRGILRRRL